MGYALLLSGTQSYSRKSVNQLIQQLLARLSAKLQKPKAQNRVVKGISDEMAEAMASRMKLDAERHRNRNQRD